MYDQTVDCKQKKLMKYTGIQSYLFNNKDLAFGFRRKIHSLIILPFTGPISQNLLRFT